MSFLRKYFNRITSFFYFLACSITLLFLLSICLTDISVIRLHLETFHLKHAQQIFHRKLPMTNLDGIERQFEFSLVYLLEGNGADVSLIPIQWLNLRGLPTFIKFQALMTEWRQWNSSLRNLSHCFRNLMKRLSAKTKVCFAIKLNFSRA